MLDPMTKLVLDQIPESFLGRLWARQTVLYEEARQHSNETQLWLGVEPTLFGPMPDEQPSNMKRDWRPRKLGSCILTSTMPENIHMESYARHL